MEYKKSKLIVDGNAFYEIDTECMRKKDEKGKNNNRKKENADHLYRKKAGA